MDWTVTFAVLVGGMMVLVFLRVPVAFALLTVSTVGLLLSGNVMASIQAIIRGFGTALASFALTTVPLFVLMGEIMFRSGVATTAIQAMERIMGRLPARLPILAAASGALLGVVSGSALASVAILARSLVPEMDKAGYPRRLGMGSILASGGLAMVIPPSTMAVIWGATASVPVGALLLAGFVPGLVMAFNYIVVMLIWFWIAMPKSANAVDWQRTPTLRKLGLFAVYIAPLGIVVFAVTGVIVLGIATPNESAALGAISAAVVVGLYRKLTFQVIKDSLIGTARVTGAILIIVGASTAFSQSMSVTGVSRGIVGVLIGAAPGEISAILLMLAIVVLLGMFLDQVAITLVTLPFFLPVMAHFDINGVWFGILMLIALQIGLTTPPFGIALFVMKEYAPPDATIRDIYLSGLPFVGADTVSIALVMVAPALALWLPQAVVG